MTLDCIQYPGISLCVVSTLEESIHQPATPPDPRGHAPSFCSLYGTWECSERTRGNQPSSVVHAHGRLLPTSQVHVLSLFTNFSRDSLDSQKSSMKHDQWGYEPHLATRKLMLREVKWLTDSDTNVGVAKASLEPGRFSDLPLRFLSYCFGFQTKRSYHSWAVKTSWLQKYSFVWCSLVIRNGLQNRI